jgi:hypothetical protein
VPVPCRWENVEIVPLLLAASLFSLKGKGSLMAKGQVKKRDTHGAQWKNSLASSRATRSSIPALVGFEALRITFVGCSTTPRGINLIFSSMLCLLDREKNANEQSFKRREMPKKTGLELL